MPGQRVWRAPGSTKSQGRKTRLRFELYGARVLSILEAELALAPGKRSELDPRVLPIASEAAIIWRDFHDHVETQCGADSPLALVRDFAAKAAEHAARIAGVLTIVEDLHAREIGRDAMATRSGWPSGTFAKRYGFTSGRTIQSSSGPPSFWNGCKASRAGWPV